MADKQVKPTCNLLVRCSNLTPVQWGAWQDYVRRRRHSPDWYVAQSDPRRYAVFLTEDRSRPAMNFKMLDCTLNMMARLLTYVPQPGDTKTADLLTACIGAVRTNVIDCGPPLTVYADRLEETGDDYEAVGVRHLTELMRLGQLYHPRLLVLYGMNSVDNPEIPYGR